MSKKSRPCLRCGKPFLTDRNHRLCKACKEANVGLHNIELYDYDNFGKDETGVKP